MAEKIYSSKDVAIAAIRALANPDGLLLCELPDDGGWAVQGTDERLADLDAAPRSDDLLRYAASKRYAVEIGGVIVNGVSLATDRQSQSMIAGAFSYVTLNPSATVKWKSPDGFVDLAAADVALIASAVAEHVQQCFAREADAVAAIVGGVATTVLDVDGFFDLA